jgi:hypothetical protein
MQQDSYSHTVSVYEHQTKQQINLACDEQIRSSTGLGPNLRVVRFHFENGCIYRTRVSSTHKAKTCYGTRLGMHGRCGGSSHAEMMKGTSQSIDREAIGAYAQKRQANWVVMWCALQADLWLEACVYACARLLSMAMHAYARLHPNTPHACVRLGSGTPRWTSCIVMHRFSAEKKLVLVEFLSKSTVCRKGT